MDTSVFGGCFDREFAGATEEFFSYVRSGHFTLLISPHNIAEMARAPLQVIELFRSFQREHLELLEPDEQVAALREAYLEAGVVTEKSWADAEHIAWASVAGAEFIVSWNFKHIVNMDRIRGYHSVNLRLGYPLLRIHTPKEVIPYEE